MQYEIWKPVVGYEGLYEVSNLGRIRSLSRNGTPGKVLTLLKETNGYLRVMMSKNGVHKKLLVHRLQAIAFIPNPLNLPQVNHKDECKTNNFIYINPDGTVDFEKSNLEWVSCKENIIYSQAFKIISINVKDSTDVTYFDSINEGARFYKLNPSHISECHKGKRKTCGGRIWKRKEAPETEASM